MRSLVTCLVGPQKSMLATAKKQTPKSCDRVVRHDTLPKTFLHGYYEGGRRSGITYGTKLNPQTNNEEWVFECFKDCLLSFNFLSQTCAMHYS